VRGGSEGGGALSAGESTNAFTWLTAHGRRKKKRKEKKKRKHNRTTASEQ
jgi:hypothetical protein